MLIADVTANPWQFQPHPEVWMVVAGVVALGGYVAGVIAPNVPTSVRGDGPAITPAQKRWFAAGVVVLWVSADWPLHDLAEQYLYALHMVQHFLLTLVVPPLFWLATPHWLPALVVPPGSTGWRWLHRLARPVPAAVIFNALTLLTHWSGIVNTSVQVAAVHYLVHLVMVTAAFLMWIPVCGPWPELRLSRPGACVYLFAQSIIPTVPGAWLAMSDSPIYSAYDHLPRLWGITVIEDQQNAGIFMKIGAGVYLWVLIVTIFFRWAATYERDHRRAITVFVDRTPAVHDTDNREAEADPTPGQAVSQGT